MRKCELNGFLVILNAWNEGKTIQCNSNHFDTGGTDNWIDLDNEKDYVFSNLKRYRIKPGQENTKYHKTFYTYLLKNTDDKTKLYGELITVIVYSNIDISKIHCVEFVDIAGNQFETQLLQQKQNHTLLRFTTLYSQRNYWLYNFYKAIKASKKIPTHYKKLECELIDLRADCNSGVELNMFFDEETEQKINDTIKNRISTKNK